MLKPERKEAVKRLKNLVLSPKMKVDEYRSLLEKTFYSPILPNHVEKAEKVYGNITCDVLSPEIFSSKRIIFYVHGGCFVGGSRSSYREFCSLLANKAFSRVVVPEYRLAPTFPFPAAIEDVQAAFRSVFTQEQVDLTLNSKNATETDNNPEIIIAADGAGSSIAMALLENMREQYRMHVKKAVFFSPWFNLTNNSVINSGKKMADEVLSTDIIQRCREMYSGDADLDNPLISPIYAARDLLTNFPPVYIQIGSKEILLEDAKKMASVLKEAGSICFVDVFDDMPHLFQMASDELLEAHDAITKFAKVISTEGRTGGRQTFLNTPHLENAITAE